MNMFRYLRVKIKQKVKDDRKCDTNTKITFSAVLMYKHFRW